MFVWKNFLDEFHTLIRISYHLTVYEDSLTRKTDKLYIKTANCSNATEVAILIDVNVCNDNDQQEVYWIPRDSSVAVHTFSYILECMSLYLFINET